MRLRKTAAATLLGFVLAQVQTAEASDIIHTDKGPIAGTDTRGVRIFLGIPYAAPPIGEARWQTPQPVPPWLTSGPPASCHRPASRTRRFHSGLIRGSS